MTDDLRTAVSAAYRQSAPGVFTAGMDLGRERDPSTLAVVEHLRVWDGGPVLHRHRLLLHLEQWPLGTPYGEVVEQAAGVLARDPWGPARPHLRYDRTGLGTAIAEQFEDAYRQGLLAQRPMGLAITGEPTARRRGGVRFSPWQRGQQSAYVVLDEAPSSVPNVELGDAIREAVETRSLEWPPDLPLLDELLRQLAAYELTATPTGRRSYGGRGRGHHADLVVAVGLAIVYPPRLGGHMRRARVMLRGRAAEERGEPEGTILSDLPYRVDVAAAGRHMKA